MTEEIKELIDRAYSLSMQHSGECCPIMTESGEIATFVHEVEDLRILFHTMISRDPGAIGICGQLEVWIDAMVSPAIALRASMLDKEWRNEERWFNPLHVPRVLRVLRRYMLLDDMAAV